MFGISFLAVNKKQKEKAKIRQKPDRWKWDAKRKKDPTDRAHAAKIIEKKISKNYFTTVEDPKVLS